MGLIRGLARRLLPQKMRAIPRICYGKIGDRARGIKTEGWYRLSQEDRAAMQYSDGNMYQPTSYRMLRKLFREVPIQEDDVFVDLGCGKGRVVAFVAQELHIKEALGIEVVPELALIAQENIERINAASPASIIREDAAKADLSQGTLFFFYEPFGRQSMERILEKIRNSAEMNPRTIRILCVNLNAKDLLDGARWLVREKIIAGRIGIWRSLVQLKDKQESAK